MEFSQDPKQIEQWLRLIDRFYEAFGWLADSFMLDFHTESHWSKLPQNWQDYLLTMSSVSLGNWLVNEDDASCGPLKINQNATIDTICPLSLQAFRIVIKNLSLQRKAASVESSSESKCAEVASQIHKRNNPNFEIIFNKHVKLKKRYEITKLSKVISSCAQTTKTNNIVDIGSGLGHLSRYLRYACDMNVTCVDCSESFSSSAKKLDDKIAARLTPQHTTNTNEQIATAQMRKKKPVHLTMRLTMGQEVNLTEYDRYGFIGLHTCGDLGPLILTTFLNSRKAKFVVSVGCCYMKLGNTGFPLSACVKDETKLKFSYEALEVASHAIEDYAAKLKASNYGMFKIHNYRATLEYLIVQKYPHLKRSGLRGVRNFESKGFKEYAREATKDLDMDFDIEEVESATVQQMLHDWWKVVIFYSLRLLMANIVETTVILDRLLYLRENGCPCSVIPVFDGIISPRNLAIVAEKESEL